MEELEQLALVARGVREFLHLLTLLLQLPAAAAVVLLETGLVEMALVVEVARQVSLPTMVAPEVREIVEGMAFHRALARAEVVLVALALVQLDQAKVFRAGLV